MTISQSVIEVFAAVGLSATVVLFTMMIRSLILFISEVSEYKHLLPAMEKDNASLRNRLADAETRKEEFKAQMLADQKACTCRPITDGRYRNNRTNPEPIPLDHHEPLRGKS